MTFHFICRGYNLRSVIAETYLKSLCLPGVNATSSGAVVDKFMYNNQRYFNHTLQLVKQHGIDAFVKSRPSS